MDYCSPGYLQYFTAFRRVYKIDKEVCRTYSSGPCDPRFFLLLNAHVSPTMHSCNFLHASSESCSALTTSAR